MRRKSFVFAILTVMCSMSVSFSQNYQWNNPGQLPSGFTHAKYHSTLMNVDIGYNIYLPPNYNSTTDRYPVVYHLHGLQGNENERCQDFSGVIPSGITSNQIPPVIVVFVNGRGNTFYSDSKDGAIKCESTIIKELIPHIDETYRTKADRTQRAIEGFSMGGFGALMLGFKHPDMFQSIASYDAALVTWDTISQQTFDRSIPSAIFGNDKNYFMQNSYPFTFARKNAETIKTLGIKVRMSTGSNDLQMGPLYYYNLAMRDTLKACGIDLNFTVVSGGGHGSSINQANIKEYLIFHTTNFSKATNISKPFCPVQSAGGTRSNSFALSTMSSFRIPGQWHNTVKAVALYNLNGKNLGLIPISGLDHIDGKVVQQQFGSGIYMLKAGM